MSTGELLTRWTVRVAVACYLLRVAGDITGGKSGRTALRRWFWTVGCGCYLVHVACAFHFFHDWSHRAAWEHTAEVTARVTGLHWGGGLWVNYLFTLFWAGDVLHWWLVPERASRTTGRWFWTVHLVFAFLMFNATAVFGPPFWIPITLGVLLLLGMLWFWRKRRT